MAASQPVTVVRKTFSRRHAWASFQLLVIRGLMHATAQPPAKPCMIRLTDIPFTPEPALFSPTRKKTTETAPDHLVPNNLHHHPTPSTQMGGSLYSSAASVLLQLSCPPRLARPSNVVHWHGRDAARIGKYKKGTPPMCGSIIGVSRSCESLIL